MEKIVRQTLLFDFYGELLTKHQQEIFEEVVCNDTSCSEIAQQEGVSRQNINELVRKCSRSLEGYEEKLHLVEKFLKIREKTTAIHDEALQEKSRSGTSGMDRILCLTDEILKEL